MKLRVFMMVGYLIVASTVSHGQSKVDVGLEVRKALEAYDTAWNKKDVTGVSAILADNYLYFTSDGRLTDRKHTLEFLPSPDYKLSFVERSEIAVLKGNDYIY